jgi:TonB family protein
MIRLVPVILATALLPQSPPPPTTELPSAPHRPSQGVSSPALVHETKPNYTAEAMRARIQGKVVLECVVMPDGSVARVRVVRSLDPVFGLDEQAINTLKQWRFRPGMKDGAPVPVLVTVEMSYTLKDRPEDPIPSAMLPGASVTSNRDAPAPLAWPDAFRVVLATTPTPSRIVDGALHQPSLDVEFSYPSTWSTVESSAGTPSMQKTRVARVPSPSRHLSPRSFR